MDYNIEGVTVKFPHNAYQTQLALMENVIRTLNKARQEEAPPVFYASRTHSQISQVVGDYDKLPQEYKLPMIVLISQVVGDYDKLPQEYKLPMVVLGSRKQYCNNPDARSKPDVDEECRALVKAPAIPQCSWFFKSTEVAKDMVKKRDSLAHQLEGLVVRRNTLKGCSYFAMWEMAKNAKLFFCPYSYLVQPHLRSLLEKFLKGAIIVFDEAHNLENTVREAGSTDLAEVMLDDIIAQLTSLNKPDYEPLLFVIKGLKLFITRYQNELQNPNPGSEHDPKSWTGDVALAKLQQCNITWDSVKNASEVIRTRKKYNEVDWNSKAFFKLEGLLFYTFEYFFTQKEDFYICLQSHGNNSGTRTHNLSFWCMKPSVVFKGLAELSSSIFLTSGTLSPMHSFSCELGINFGTCFEASHVIQKWQVCARAIFKGANNELLKATLANASKHSFQDSLGKTLEEICQRVPNGSLVFFPSYRLMMELCYRWKQTSQWERLHLNRTLFTEPSTSEETNPVLIHYKKSLHEKGASTLLAVCRGKVAEGMDFSDDSARAVVIVGIPYLNTKDVKIQLKRTYNNKFSKITGSEWYCQQAFRAINQSVGRCIRHVSDYGAILFLDSRYEDVLKQPVLSKWIRGHMKASSLEDCLLELPRFFEVAKCTKICSDNEDAEPTQQLAQEGVNAAVPAIAMHELVDEAWFQELLKAEHEAEQKAGLFPMQDLGGELSSQWDGWDDDEMIKEVEAFEKAFGESRRALDDF